MKTLHCKCGVLTGTRCEWRGPEAETTLIEYVPEHMRSDVARHPEMDWSNAWRTLRCERSCARMLAETDPEFVHEVCHTDV